jgi:hypothetical protein
MAVRARFYVATITQHATAARAGYAEPLPLGEVTLRPATRGEHNREWASATPSGEFKMTVNGPAYPWFAERLGREVSITLDDVPPED